MVWDICGSLHNSFNFLVEFGCLLLYLRDSLNPFLLEVGLGMNAGLGMEMSQSLMNMKKVCHE